MDISSKTWKATAKQYREFYNLTLKQAQGWQGKCFAMTRKRDNLARRLQVDVDYAFECIKDNRYNEALQSLREAQDIIAGIED